MSIDPKDSQFALQGGHLGLEPFYLLGLLLNDLLLGSALVQTGCRHTFSDAALLNKLIVPLFDKGTKGFIDHVAETNGTIGHLLVCPGLIISVVGE